MVPLSTANLGLYPIHGASAEQRVVQGYHFQEKLRRHGKDAALAYAATLGVDVKYHLDAQLKAPCKLHFLRTVPLSFFQTLSSNCFLPKQCRALPTRSRLATPAP